MAALLIVLLLPFLLVGFPYLRLEWRRRQQRQHPPRPQEIWAQDRSQILYVEAVSEQGIELLTFDPVRGQITRWRERCEKRVILFTGRTGTLPQSPWEAMRT